MRSNYTDFIKPLSYVYTLNANASLALRYTDGFTFVHCGTTNTLECNDTTPKPPGVNLTNIDAVLVTTMTKCPSKHQAYCQRPRTVHQNVVAKRVRSFAYAGYDCFGSKGDL